MGRHSGFPVTYRRVRRLFAWPKMKDTIRQYVCTCSVCQQAKPERVKYLGLLEPLPLPEGAWEVVTMDFIDGLPQSNRANCILVVVDKFTRHAHFLPLNHPFTAAKVARTYLDNVYKLHGLPKVIISDQDSVFTSRFWRELFKIIGTELNMSTPYHPQTDGQSERVNQCLEIYLRCFIHACPNHWSQYLSLAEFWYNSSHHSALDMSPFHALYGHEPRHWGIEAASTCKIPDLKEWLEERKTMQQVLKQHLHRARHIMKVQADKKRTDRSFQPGDAVYIKLQPRVQTSVDRRANHKLSFKYFGPFSVLHAINPVAYELNLPPGSKIHPVFHVSQMRQALSPGTTASTNLPIPSAEELVPVEIIRNRWRQTPSGRREQLLVRWSDTTVVDATWEDALSLKHLFPHLSAWGQAASQGGGDVSIQTTSSDMDSKTAAMATEGKSAAMAANPEELAAKWTSQGEDRVIARPARIRHVNRRFMGPEWLNTT